MEALLAASASMQTARISSFVALCKAAVALRVASMDSAMCAEYSLWRRSDSCMAVSDASRSLQQIRQSANAMQLRKGNKYLVS